VRWSACAWPIAAVVAAAPLVCAAAVRQDPVYRVPLRPACDASTLEGEGVRLAYLSRELNTAWTPVVAPWQRFVGEAREEPENVFAHLDLARCLYVFIRGLGDSARLAEVDQSLARALALVQAEAANQPPVVPRARPPLRTGRDVPMPQRVAFQAPDYPILAERQQISGTVFVEATIDASGAVRRTQVVGSLPPLDEAAATAVRAWRYQPSTVTGRRVEVVHIAAIRFSTAAESAADFMDIARFHYARKEGANAAAALTRAIDRVRQDRATLDPAPAVDLLAELSAARGYQTDRSITPPAVIKQAPPKYTREAMREKIVGTVQLDAVVLTDGTIGAVRITQSLDPVHGLDVEAGRAAKQWRFKPAVDAAGTRIPVRVTLLIDFRLH
jgi:TonB family protein